MATRDNLSGRPLQADYALDVRDAVHITGAEWRWLAIAVTALIVLAFLPVILLSLGPSRDQFTGVLHNYLDGATYLAKMRLGADGGWLVSFLHTPTAHDGALVQTLYPLLGQAARATGIPSIILFHMARAFATAFMYAAIYLFGAVIWSRVTPRRAFFLIAAVGAGFGWLFGPLLATVDLPDFALLPEAFPFFSSLVNVHFPLTIGCLALLLGLLVLALRPGHDAFSGAQYGWLSAVVLSILLAILYPQALAPVIGALCLSVLIDLIRLRRVRPALSRMTLAVVLPALPFAAYLLLVVGTRPIFQQWNAQNVTPAPAPWLFALGFGLPLILAIPGLIRALRRMEADGDQLMLLWLLSMLLLVFLPTNIQRRFAVGIMLPIAYFAVRGLVSFWAPRIPGRLTRPLFLVALCLMAVSPLVYLLLPVATAVAAPERATGVMLDAAYSNAAGWLDERGDQNTVVLAAPPVSAWLPGMAGVRVVYGHPYETVPADANRAAVEGWYAASAGCGSLLSEFGVDYVLVGPLERALGPADCAATLTPAAVFGPVTIYAP